MIHILAIVQALLISFTVMAALLSPHLSKPNPTWFVVSGIIAFGCLSLFISYMTVILYKSWRWIFLITKQSNEINNEEEKS